MKNNKSFNLFSVIILIVITSVLSAITAGVIVTNNYALSYGNIKNDSKLNEFLKAYSNIVDNYYENVDTDAMLDSALNAMLKYLGDDYTTFLNENEKANLEQRLSGTYKGIGVTIEKRTVIAVTSDSPAEYAGIKPGDVFVKVNGTDVSNVDHNAISVLIKNNKKNEVNLVMDRDGVELEFNIPYATLIDPSIAYQLLEDTDGVGYIQIDVFSKTLTEQMESAMQELKNAGMKSLIIDVRDNQGGYLDVAKSTTSIFLEKGKLIYSLEDKEKSEKFYDETDEAETMPIIVLINEKSASASEILAAALKDSYGAILVGTRSYGKGKVQQTYELDDGSMAKYTTAKWLRPNGTCIDGVGIVPDYELDLADEYDESGQVIGKIDTQFNKALEIMSTK